MLKLQKKHKKSSTEIQSSAIIVHETKRTATSTRTTHTRQNNPYKLGAAPAGVVGAEIAAVRTWCGGAMSISNAMPLRFASGVPYGFRDSRRFELGTKNFICKNCASKALGSQIKAVFAPIREQHTRVYDTRYFQQPMSARTMRVCTVCSERWDTAEDGGGDYRRVVCCTKKKEHTYRGHHLPWRKNKGKKIKGNKNGRQKKGKKKTGARYRTREL